MKKTMKKIIDFLNKSVTFYLATVEDDRPKIRPFGASAEYEGKVYIATSNKKKVFSQILANPYVTISSILDERWIRIEGKLLVDNRPEAKQAILEAKPYLKDYFSVDDGNFEVLYFSEGKATFKSFYSNIKPDVIKL